MDYGLFGCLDVRKTPLAAKWWNRNLLFFHGLFWLCLLLAAIKLKNGVEA